MGFLEDDVRVYDETYTMSAGPSVTPVVYYVELRYLDESGVAATWNSEPLHLEGEVDISAMEYGAYALSDEATAKAQAKLDKMVTPAGDIDVYANRVFVLPARRVIHYRLVTFELVRDGGNYVRP